MSTLVTLSGAGRRQILSVFSETNSDLIMKGKPCHLLVYKDKSFCWIRLQNNRLAT